MYKKELIKLSQAGVRYMVIGGVALGLSGYPRATLDLDLLVDFSEENLDKFLQVVNRMGYKPRGPVDLSLLKEKSGQKRKVRRFLVSIRSKSRTFKSMYS